MGAKTWIIVTCDSSPRKLFAAKPALDRVATKALADRLYTKPKLRHREDVDLRWRLYPRGPSIVMGVFPSLTLVATREIDIDNPSQLPEALRTHSGHEWAYLYALGGDSNWFAYAIWRRGELIRSLSLSWGRGILEDLGTRQPFELPFWAGKEIDPEDLIENAPYPFDSYDLSERALGTLFGFDYFHDDHDPSLIDPRSITLMGFVPRRWLFF